MMPPLIKRLLLVAVLAVASACGSNGTRLANVDTTPTLGELGRVDAPVEPDLQPSGAVAESQQALLESVSDAYHDALAVSDNDTDRNAIHRRLAHIDLQIAENRQIHDAQTDPATLYQPAIASYLALLDSPANADISVDELLYPLAKAYDLSGDSAAAEQTFARLVTEVPESRYFAEAQFRRGEILFVAAQYQAAGLAYRSAFQRDDTGTFAANARYMAGWADFKRGHYQPAIDTWLEVLHSEAELGSEYFEQRGVARAFQLHGGDADSAEQADGSATAGFEAASSREALIEDTFRVLALAYSYEAGAQTLADSLAAQYDATAEPFYVKQLFADLAALYLEKKRYLDSADTLLAYADRYPLADDAAAFYQQRIAVYYRGGFPDLVREEKQAFVERFGVGSEYWQAYANVADQGGALVAALQNYIGELASYHHNLAQTLAAQRDTAVNGDGEPLDTAQLAALCSRIHGAYSDAGNWYQRWIESFPEDPGLGEIWFLLGEVRFESAAYAEAVVAYENAAYGDVGALAASDDGMQRAAEAGYAALLAYDQLLTASDGEQRQSWQLQKNDSALLFASAFGDDERVVPVLAQTTESQLALAQYPETIDTANWLLRQLGFDLEAGQPLVFSPATPSHYALTGWLSLGHAQRSLDEYANAEHAYQNVLQLLDRGPGTEAHDRYYDNTLDNYAASIYQQADAHREQGDIALAASTFMRVVERAPGTEARIAAQHDASLLFEQLQDWGRVIELVSDFQQRFPGQPQVAAIPARLLQAYQASGNVVAAASQALSIADNDPDAAARQEALYLAAELFEQAGDRDNAIDKYRRYAHDYPQPVAPNVEAQFKLTELYAQSDAPSKRNFWLEKLVATHAGLEQPSERAVYLAAFASTELAEQTMQRYQQRRLSNPLKKSLQRKRKAMDEALAAYEKVDAYEVEVFSTQATHRMAQIYQQLAGALLDSPRPANLSELELEQYNLLLEEQAYPFEETAIELYVVNVERAWAGSGNDWITRSYAELAQLLPARFAKPELVPGHLD